MQHRGKSARVGEGNEAVIVQTFFLVEKGGRREEGGGRREEGGREMFEGYSSGLVVRLVVRLRSSEKTLRSTEEGGVCREEGGGREEGGQGEKSEGGERR